MATRRNVPTLDEKTPTSPTSSSTDRILTPSQQAASATLNTPAVPARVVYKLLFFTFAMVVGPIGIYFLTVNNVFGGNTTWAGATAAVTANIVLIGYILAAVWEDQGEEGERAATAVGKMKGRSGKVE